MIVDILVPLLTAFAIAAGLGPIIIPALHRLHISNTEREELKSHQKKNGTPSMGGVLILIAVTVVCVFYIPHDPKILPVLWLTWGFGLIGFLDDFLKVKKHDSDGLIAWQKMLLELVVTTVFLIFMLSLPDTDLLLRVPFTGYLLNAGWITYPLLYFVVLGTVNGVNFTDGLDGLASSVTAVVAAFFGFASLALGANVEPIAAAVVGALLGFLLYNVHPAKVFMGDTGSLALGGFVAGMAYVLQMPLFLLIVGLIYVVEILSVVIQVLYFKATHGKRFFRMAPIHHHFELGGWSETRVTAVFTIVTILLCLIGYAAIGPEVR